MPRGREGMPAELSALLPPPGEPGSRPLLTPQGVLYSSSYFMDLGKLWENRAKLLNAEQLKKLEEFDKNSGRFLAGTRMSRLLTEAGPYQRIVVATRRRAGYRTKPVQYIPAFALVLEMREPESFSKRAETILRGAALWLRRRYPSTSGTNPRSTPNYRIPLSRRWEIQERSQRHPLQFQPLLCRCREPVRALLHP